jgi:hypothetical protein
MSATFPLTVAPGGNVFVCTGSFCDPIHWPRCTYPDVLVNWEASLFAPGSSSVPVNINTVNAQQTYVDVSLTNASSSTTATSLFLRGWCLSLS